MHSEFRIGLRVVQPDLNTIVYSGKTTRVEPKVMEVLVYLAQHPGEVVGRESLIRDVWGDTFVTDAALTRCIGELRKVFDDDVREPRVIQTIAKSGYRLIAPVEAADRAAIEPSTATPARIGSRMLLPVALFAIAALAAAGVIAWNLNRPAPEPPIVRFAIDLEAEIGNGAALAAPPAISPDGKHIVLAVRRGDHFQLYLRPIDRMGATPISGTEGALHPFFSPDGQWVAFVADSKLKRVPLSGGLPVVLCNAIRNPRGTWSFDRSIVFELSGYGLASVPASGGVSSMVTRADVKKGERFHLNPEVLPGGDLLFGIEPTSFNEDDAAIIVQSRKTGERRVILRGGRGPRYLPTGHLVFMRRRTLMAVRFDPVRGEISGEPFPALEDVLPSADWALEDMGGVLGTSRSGVVVYASAGPKLMRRLVWVDRKGEREPLPVAPKPLYQFPSLSPDDSRIAVGIEGDGLGSDIWIHHIGNAAWTRLTFGGRNFFPIWTPDGKRVAFTSARDGALSIWWKLADGSDAEQRLPAEDVTYKTSFSPNGKLLAYYDNQINPETGHDLWTVAVDGSSKPELFLRTANSEVAPMFSPDGRHVAYSSNEAGRWEVFVRPFRGTGGPWQVSHDGGTEPRWAANGRELFYRSGDQMLAAEVVIDPTFRKGKTEVLFRGSFRRGGYANYDVTADGKRFLMIEVPEDVPVTRLNVVIGWFQDLKARDAARRH